MLISYFFPIKFFFHRQWWFLESRGRERTNFYSFLSFPSAQDHSEITKLHLRWLLRIFNCIACNHQAVNLGTFDACFFFSQWFLSDTNDSQDNRGRKGSNFYSTFSFPSPHSNIYLQLCIWDGYHKFLNASHHGDYISMIACNYETATR